MDFGRPHGLLNIKHLPNSWERFCVFITGSLILSPPCFFPYRPTRAPHCLLSFTVSAIPAFFLSSWHRPTSDDAPSFHSLLHQFLFRQLVEGADGGNGHERGHLYSSAAATATLDSTSLVSSPDDPPFFPFSLVNLIVIPQRFDYPSSIDPDLSVVCAWEHSLREATDTAHQGRAPGDRLEQLVSSLIDVILPPSRVVTITE